MADEPSPDHGQFRRSTFSGGGNCVEVAFTADGAATVRNSHEPDRSLTFTATEWDTFVAGVKDDQFDRPTT